MTVTSSIRLSEAEILRRLRLRHRLAKDAIRNQRWGLELIAQRRWREVDELDREIAEACR